MVSEVDFQERLAPGGYTRAADMWSFGMLVAFILTGQQKLSHEKLLEDSPSDLEEALPAFIERVHSRKNIDRKASEFMLKLLVVEPIQRMTAEASTTHEWFTKPLLEATELRMLYERTIRSWEERPENEALVEKTYVGSHVRGRQPPKARQQKTLRFRSKSTSSYIGLDRHLRVRQPSRKKLNLDSLNDLDFLTEKINGSSSSRDHSINKYQVIQRAKVVDGSNMFGSSPIIPDSMPASQELAASCSPVTKARQGKNHNQDSRTR